MGVSDLPALLSHTNMNKNLYSPTQKGASHTKTLQGGIKVIMNDLEGLHMGQGD